MSTGFREPTATDVTKGVVIIGLFVLSLVIAAVILTAGGETWSSIAAFVVIVIIGLTALIRWHAHVTAYRCPSCGHEFTITAFTDLVSPHMLKEKYLRCPQCAKRGWAKVLMRT